MITNKALEILENNLVFARTINRQYDDSFAKEGAKIGASLRVRKPARYIPTEGAALQVQDFVEEQVTLSITNQAQQAINFTTAELTLSLDDFADRVLKPAISQMAASIDSNLASLYKKVYQSVGTPGTTPATSLVLLQAQQKLNEMAAFPSPRYLTVDPAANASLVEGMKGLFNPVSTISRQFKNGLMGEGILGIEEINMSQSIKKHTCGTRSGTITVSTTVSTQGASTVTLAGTTGHTLVEGDQFTIADVYAVNPQTRESTGSLQQFTVTALNTAAGSAFTNVAISPAIYTATHPLATVNSFPASSAAVTVVGTASTAYPQNLLYHRDAFTLATADLVMPNNVDMAARKVYNGLSMRIVRQYDINSDRLPCRIDVLYGYGALRPELAARIWG